MSVRGVCMFTASEYVFFASTSFHGYLTSQSDVYKHTGADTWPASTNTNSDDTAHILITISVVINISLAPFCLSPTSRPPQALEP